MFDFGLAVIEGMVPAFFGIILGTALLRAMPRAATLGVVMIAAAYGGQYLWSENTSERQIENEKSARTKIQRLIEAQESYRLSNVIKGYSCNLMELGQTFENVVEFEPRYAARYSRATDGIFIYDLVCVSKGKRIDKFVLIARTPPSVRSSRYAYCADETGVVRELDRRVATSCMPGGVIPPGKMIDIETFIANKKLKN